MLELPEIAHSWVGTAALSTDEERVLGTIVWKLLAGHPVAGAELAAVLGLPGGEVEPILAGLQAKGCLRRDGHGAVIAARGLMLEGSAHRLVTEYGAVYTQCSVDAIGIPAALGIGATIEDRCAHCDRAIGATVLGGEVSVRPTSAVVVMAEACGAKTDEIPMMCHETNLFCSSVHAKRWQAEQGTLPTAVVTPADAVAVGRAIWGRFAPSTHGTNAVQGGNG
jgi:hypothetical protein